MLAVFALAAPAAVQWPAAAPAAADFPPDAIDVQTGAVLSADDLLFTSVRHLSAPPPAGQPWRPEVFAMDLQTLQYHRLTFMDSQAMRHMAASPDRTKLAMTRIPADTNGDGSLDELDDQVVWVVDLEAGKAWPLTEAGASAGAGGVDWLDNQTVVFNYRAAASDLYDLAKADYLTKARTMLTSTPTIGESDVGAFADGTLLSYVAVDTTDPLGSDALGPIFKSKVWLINADGSGPRQVTDGGPLVGRAGPLSAGDYDPELSPDGTKVVFTRAVALGTNDLNPSDAVPPAGTHRVYTVDVATLQTTELTQNDSVALIPDWAAGGAIYFSEVAITAEHSADPYLGIAATSEAGGLTRIEPFPPSDIWKGALVVKLLPPWDSDGDGYSDAAEASVGTDPFDACADTPAPNDETDDKWPPDFNDDRVVNVSDVFELLPPYFGSAVPPASPRRDLAPNGVINISDLFALLPPTFGSSCAP